MANIIKLDKETKTIQVYFTDLTLEAQSVYLDFQGLESAADSPLDFLTIPVFLLTKVEGT